MKKIAIGSDHGGYLLKEEIIKHLKEKGYEVIDFGTNSEESCDYPVYGAAVGRAVASKEADFGIVVCGSGEGITMAANKIHGVRAGIGYDDTVSGLLREHNNANVIGFGARFMKTEDVIRRVDIFLNTEFAHGRHEKRINLLSELDK